LKKVFLSLPKGGGGYRWGRVYKNPSSRFAGEITSYLPFL